MRGLDALTTLADFSIAHWDVDPGRLQAFLPPGFTATAFPVGGRPRAVVGAVSFRDTRFRFAAAPFLRFHMGQVNYRAYVRHQGRDVAWFFGTTLTGPAVAVPRLLWRLPWHAARTRLDCAWDGDRLVRYAMETRSRWAPATLRARGTGRRLQPFGPLASWEETRRILTHPTEGYFRRRDGAVGTYSIWRAPLDLEEAEPEECRFALYERLGLVGPGQPPLHVLAQREVDFRIFLPPRRVPS